MSKKTRKRRNSRHPGFVFLLCALSALLVGSAFLGTASGADAVVYKPMRPPVDSNAVKKRLPPPLDFNYLPDPFLSYLVAKTRRELAAKEQERKRKEAAEKRLEKLKDDVAKKLRKMQEPKTDLQKIRTKQLTLTAIVEGGDRAWAMVRDASAMGYVLKRGTPIGTKGGRVAQISLFQKRVVIKVPLLSEDKTRIEYKRESIDLSDVVFE